MKSPFPGMDPYLQSRWSDVHVSLTHLAKAALQPKLPPSLRARSEEEVLIEDDLGLRDRFEAGTVVIELPGKRQGASKSDIAVAEPIVIEKVPRRVVDRWVQIVDTAAGNRVVTAIEFLSPANKRAGVQNRRYLRKVNRYLDAGVNLVEIDLIRSPRRRLPVTLDDLPVNSRTPYLVCVSRSTKPHQWGVVPIGLRTTLPAISIPLRPDDPEASLNLQELIQQVYIDGGHDDIDYTKPCKPRLDPDDAVWAAALIRSRT